MLLGHKTKVALLYRHLLIGGISALLLLGFWLSRLDWTPDMRLWRAFGDAGFVLLFLTLSIGPLAKLWHPANRLFSWRRELGIWFGVTAIIHSVLIIDGWVQWNVLRFLGYEFLPQLERYARVEPGFGLANLIGLVALFFTVVLIICVHDYKFNY